MADAGYESEENYVYLEKNKQNSFIKPQTYESMKKARFKKNISKLTHICQFCYFQKKNFDV